MFLRTPLSRDIIALSCRRNYGELAISFSKLGKAHPDPQTVTSAGSSYPFPNEMATGIWQASALSHKRFGTNFVLS